MGGSGHEPDIDRWVYCTCSQAILLHSETVFCTVSNILKVELKLRVLRMLWFNDVNNNVKIIIHHSYNIYTKVIFRFISIVIG